MRLLLKKIGGITAALVVCFGAVRIAQADSFQVDPVHSFVVFDVHHVGAGYVYGTFQGPTGAIDYVSDDASQDKFDVSVNTETLDTRNPMRNKDLKGPDFFDVKQYGTMTFKSTSVKKSGDEKLDVTGDLTLHGITKSITVPMEMTGVGKGMRGETRGGFRADFTIDRRDFGLTADPAPVIGNEVHVIVALEGIKQ